MTARLAEEHRAKSEIEKMSVPQALQHPAVLVLTAGLFFTYSGGYAFWFWFPTMLQRLTGWTDVQRIGWVGAIPFIAGLIGMLLLGWNSDRTRERRWHFAIPQLTSAIALGAWFFLPHQRRAFGPRFHIRRVRYHRVSAVVLGAAQRVPHQFGRRCSGRFYQLHREYRWFYRTKNFRRTQSTHGIVRYRFRPDDCLLRDRVRARADLSAGKNLTTP